MLTEDSEWFATGKANAQRILDRQSDTNTAKNVILLVSDGNGIGTNYATRIFQGQQNGGFGDDHVLHYEAFPYLALVKTYNLNAQTPDSAPTAGAMNTGVKQRFETINVGATAIAGDCTTQAANELTKFAEIVAADGKAVGNLARTVQDGVAFADAVAMADEMTNDEDTLIIVPADHDRAISFNGYCGRGSPITGLCMKISKEGLMNSDEPALAADGLPYTVAGSLNGDGSVLCEDKNWADVRPEVTTEEAMDIDYLQQALIPRSSKTHSGVDVAVYAIGQ